MAKKGKKRGFRIPKEIGGVKVPKEARRAGDALIEKASSPEGRQALASGLAMAATFAAAAAARQSRQTGATGSACHPGANTRKERGSTPGIDPTRVADAFGEAANAFMNKVFSPK